MPVAGESDVARCRPCGVSSGYPIGPTAQRLCLPVALESPWSPPRGSFRRTSLPKPGQTQGPPRHPIRYRGDGKLSEGTNPQPDLYLPTTECPEHTLKRRQLPAQSPRRTDGIHRQTNPSRIGCDRDRTAVTAASEMAFDLQGSHRSRTAICLGGHFKCPSRGCGSSWCREGSTRHTWPKDRCRWGF